MPIQGQWECRAVEVALSQRLVRKRQVTSIVGVNTSSLRQHEASARVPECSPRSSGIQHFRKASDAPHLTRSLGCLRLASFQRLDSPQPVSYTHLTLPTIHSV